MTNDNEFEKMKKNLSINPYLANVLIQVEIISYTGDKYIRVPGSSKLIRHAFHLIMEPKMTNKNPTVR